MAEQPDLWPLRAPRNDPDFPLRDRWRYALMLLGVIETSGIPRRAVQKWVATPGAPDTELVSIFYGWDGAEVRVAEAKEFLLEQGLTEEKTYG